MSKKVILICCLMLSGTAAFCQQQENLLEFNRSAAHTMQTGMLVLGGWAAGNMIVNGLLMPGANGSRYYFYQMNVFWNIVNLGIASFGYYNAVNADISAMNMVQTVEQYHQYQKILLLNTGLDVAYMVTGLYLLEKARNNTSQQERLTGYGRSVILQGAFLFTFDLALYFMLQRQHPALDHILNHVSIHPQGIRLLATF